MAKRKQRRNSEQHIDKNILVDKLGLINGYYLVSVTKGNESALYNSLGGKYSNLRLGEIIQASGGFNIGDVVLFYGNGYIDGKTDEYTSGDCVGEFELVKISSIVAKVN